MPKRIHIEFERHFSGDSINGKAFGWLKENIPNYADTMTNLVRMVYLPIALAESGESPETVQRAVNYAREFFESKMLLALGSCAELMTTGEQPSVINPIGLNGSAPSNGKAEAYPVLKLTQDEDF
jgi:hypothetical protein